ncbi:hypothetical protein ASC97_05830 [Rhizobium sp. Root1203]|nr:hypothetical protein ASC97_05830 [Rhizobium sp. Root1203]
MECHGCGNDISQEWLEESCLSTQDVIGVQGGRVFCCAPCKTRDDEVESEKRRFEGEFIETLRAVVRQRFGDVKFHGTGDAFRPGAYILSQDGAYGVGEAMLHFEFPGMSIAPATIEFRWPFSFRWDGIGPVNLVYRCCAGDRLAFEEFAGEAKKVAA